MAVIQASAAIGIRGCGAYTAPPVFVELFFRLKKKKKKKRKTKKKKKKKKKQKKTLAPAASLRTELTDREHWSRKHPHSPTWK